MKCCQSQHNNFYREPHRSSFSSQNCLYLAISTTIFIVVTYFLRDTTPVRFVKPSINDMSFDSDTVASHQLNDVYWRVSIRHINNMLSEVCKQENYTVLTNKNIESDNKRMKANYIYFCEPLDSTISAMLNARVVLSTVSSKTIRCKETYGTKTKTILREYPFSLKYIDAVDFSRQTKIIRNRIEACTILHAIDIVHSSWD